MNIIYFCFILATFFVLKAKCYCILNVSPDDIKVHVYKSLQVFSHRWPVLSAKPVKSGDYMCCHWQVDDCFGLSRINNDKEWTNRSVALKCSKFNNIYTYVEFPRGGYLVVKKSPEPELDNKIIVYGHQNNYLGYSYDCGFKDKVHLDYQNQQKINN